MVQLKQLSRVYYICKELLMSERTYKKDLDIINIVSRLLQRNFAISPFPRCIIIMCLRKTQIPVLCYMMSFVWLLLLLFLSKFVAENTLLPDRQMAML